MQFTSATWCSTSCPPSPAACARWRFAAHLDRMCRRATMWRPCGAIRQSCSACWTAVAWTTSASVPWPTFSCKLSPAVRRMLAFERIEIRWTNVEPATLCVCTLLVGRTDATVDATERAVALDLTGASKRGLTIASRAGFSASASTAHRARIRAAAAAESSVPDVPEGSVLSLISDNYNKIVRMRDVGNVKVWRVLQRIQVRFCRDVGLTVPCHAQSCTVLPMLSMSLERSEAHLFHRHHFRNLARHCCPHTVAATTDHAALPAIYGRPRSERPPGRAPGARAGTPAAACPLWHATPGATR